MMDLATQGRLTYKHYVIAYRSSVTVRGVTYLTIGWYGMVGFESGTYTRKKFHFNGDGTIKHVEFYSGALAKVYGGVAI